MLIFSDAAAASEDNNEGDIATDNDEDDNDEDDNEKGDDDRALLAYGRSQYRYAYL